MSNSLSISHIKNLLKAYRNDTVFAYLFNAKNQELCNGFDIEETDLEEAIAEAFEDNDQVFLTIKKKATNGRLISTNNEFIPIQKPNNMPNDSITTLSQGNDEPLHRAIASTKDAGLQVVLSMLKQANSELKQNLKYKDEKVSDLNNRIDELKEDKRDLQTQLRQKDDEFKVFQAQQGFMQKNTLSGVLETADKSSTLQSLLAMVAQKALGVDVNAQQAQPAQPAISTDTDEGKQAAKLAQEALSLNPEDIHVFRQLIKMFVEKGPVNIYKLHDLYYGTNLASQTSQTEQPTI